MGNFARCKKEKLLEADVLEKILKEAFPDAEVKLMDLTGGGDHWQVEIASSAFRDKTLIQQHKLVYGAFGDHMKEKIHALSISTKVL